MGRGGHYLLTWTTYGTWLPGDARGFVSRYLRDDGGWVIENGVGTPRRRDDRRARSRAAERQLGAPLRLVAAAGAVVGDSLLEVETTHGLRLDVAAIMRSHVHVVVASRDAEGAQLLRLCKGVASRRLGQRVGPPPVRWWTKQGSHRLLPSRDAVSRAIEYVERQPGVLVWVREGCVVRADAAPEPPA